MWTRAAAHWRLIAGLVLLPLLVGSTCAFFLWSLEAVTQTRFRFPWLLYFLPAAGCGVGWFYHRYGREVEGGNNLLIEQIHTPGGGVRRRMAPLILLGTLVTHLFGGSAGREGTAVQIGGSIASGIGRLFGLTNADTRVMLMSGVACGFGAVFGTPLAGAVFAVEVLTLGQLEIAALPACLFSAHVGDRICRAWGTGHAHYRLGFLVDGSNTQGYEAWNTGLLCKIILAGALVGLVSRVFVSLMHRSAALFARWSPAPQWRPVLGGLCVVALFLLVQDESYLGLGVSAPRSGIVTIPLLLEPAATPVSPFAWVWKLAFTVLTLASGFKGGEVTPLFFIGAALGNAFAQIFGAPLDLFAALGMVGIFAGATNTPFACTIMGAELFGVQYTGYLALACGGAYLCSGRIGIYHAQRLGKGKFGRFLQRLW